MRLAIAIGLLLACSCAPPVPSAPPPAVPAPSPPPPPEPPRPDALSAEALGAHVRALCAAELAGRRAGSPGERAAFDYAARQLAALGLTVHEQEVPLREGTSANLYARIGPASEELIVLGAHIDHLGLRRGEMHLGAEDNASGVAVVLGIAAQLARPPAGEPGRLERAVVVVLFGAEEIGMIGSRHFVERIHELGAPVVAMINVDMIGRPLADAPRYRLPKRLLGIDDRRSVGVLGTRDRPSFREPVDRAFGAVGLTAIGLEDLPGPLVGVVRLMTEGRGDSFRFERAGIPSLFFSSGESADYHRPSDTPERLDLELMAARARGIHRLVLELSARRTVLPPGELRDRAAAPG